MSARPTTAGLLALAMLMGACHAQPVAAPGAHGRYVGVGIYAPTRPWTQMVAQKTSDRGAATLADDQAIIVVTDSVTGEVRACGDMTGYCIAMNPWRVGSQTAPVKLAEHRDAPVDESPAANTADNEAASATK